MGNLLERFKQLPKYISWALIGVLLIIIVIYYPVGMLVVNNIDDSDQFSASAYEVENGSHSVSMAIALIDRETNQHQWVASSPFFYPSALLVRMPAFQRGIMTTIARFTIEMSDQIGRTRGSSQTDTDLQKAAGLLNYSPYVWLFDFSTSWLPTTSSQTQYRAGMEALQKYNTRLASGTAVFDRRADNLIETINRMANDLGSASAALAERIENGSGFNFNTDADLYYHSKGRLYATYLILRELQRDFADIVKEKQLEAVWNQTLESLKAGMTMNNFFVLNAAPDSAIIPSHLASQGFFLMRARTQMYEITNILLK
jgi:hypothetical protein